MKEKVTISKEECERLMRMLNSSDRDNSFIALKAINESNIEESVSFILLLYKFSNIGTKEWRDNAPNAYEKLKQIKIIDEIKGMPTASAVLTTMIRIDAPLEAVKKYLEFHSEQLIETLSSWGYPMRYMNVEITLKEKEYEQDRLISKS
jgi:hypothetical protein